MDSSKDDKKTLGMTSAVSLAYPKESDIKLTKQLEDYLRNYDMFESDAELNHRYVLTINIYTYMYY